MAPRFSLHLVALLGLALGCGIDTAEPRPDDGTLVPSECTTRGSRMLRRLTNLQRRNTLQAVFRDPNVPVSDILNDPVILGFRADATQSVVRDLDAQLIMDNAESIASWVVMQKLGQVTTCQTTDPTCVRQFIATLGKQLYREPVPAASVDSYVQLFGGETSFADGARVVISAMLQSPYFLYRRELGERGSDGLYHLTPYELASSLSYMLTSGPPDATLMTAADQGRLASPADLDREAARLLATPESATAFGTFVRNWLVIDDLATRAKMDPTNRLTDAIRTAMLEETARLFVNVLRSNAKIAELFTASYTFVDPNLAGYYQLPGVGGGFQRVELPSSTRALGVLGHGSILTRHALADRSSPVQRGKLVRERLLCEELTPPPPTVDTNLPPPMGNFTTRQRYEQHVQAEFCKGCHQLTDPVGFAFEHFDGFGRKRDQENGLPIDATGTLSGMAEGDIALDGIDSLSRYLAGSKQATQCLVRYMSYSAYGLDHCSEADIGNELAAGDGSLKSIVMAILHAPQFATRTGD
ncbi:MAG TPA: DUF1592 domain-containing protein [Kofleriaceae bacterium]|nr:DUF1592 domain-containing protein [Kofleriaceae bacterium]